MRTVLLVDDSAFMRKWITGIIEKSENYKVIAEASNGREALIQYDKHRPDLVMMDIAMDEMDGLQTLEHLQRIFPGVKVVMCSSLGHHTYTVDYLKLGAKDFVVKPFFEDLVGVLDKIN